MADSESGYKVGPGRPPLHTRFQKGQSGNPGGRGAKTLPALLTYALNETVDRHDRRTAPQAHQARGISVKLGSRDRGAVSFCTLFALDSLRSG